MGEPRGQSPQRIDEAQEDPADEIEERSLADDSPNTRADVVFDRTPCRFSLEAGVGPARGAISGEAGPGSPMEAAGATLVTMVATAIPPAGIGVLLVLTKAPAAAVAAAAISVWLAAVGIFFWMRRRR
ncbi:hypothetical protein O4J56_02285 [Nocardiopsis sp. RSe5-2]|uniref:Uncharacterized protein n=1 Tax=Nocardiopsis endophytica TaxID=3018445 RepID=A0ABT4TXP6_9ACTN|nr:hypothetical protein [Nocardiopsis endophytica]MDA2809455.1 hypothetical protein [Nocardiopsis endophytica]